jgi:hypothetical protein
MNTNDSIFFKKAFSLLLITLFFACQKDQLLVKKIEGTYRIEKMIYSTSHGDSVVNAPNGTMFFGDCVLKSQTDGQQCDGYLEINGRQRINFGYRPREDGEKISMFLNMMDLDNLNRFGGRYVVEERTGRSLTLIRYRYDEYQERNIDLQIFLSK